MSDDVIASIRKLGFPWETIDPFLFCVYHDDAYPAGNDAMGPAASLAGRELGQDFAGKDGWRMYHGMTVPGFPAHPHRGFETVTIVRRGLIDHSDSLGATARFGGGDVQWLTAGKGIVHSEMFPLLLRDKDNPLELFQIWLNLPAKDKMVEPHFTMLWSEQMPRRTFADGQGGTAEVVCVAGAIPGLTPPLTPLPPPPDSWASRAESALAIWTIKLSPGARWVLPAATAAATATATAAATAAATATATRRSLYFFKGATLRVAGQETGSGVRIELRGEREAMLINGPAESELLLLQGMPLGEPVAQYGPFVMNTQAEIQQAFADYRQTQFGGWPWPSDAPVHLRERGRFARHADGRLEEKE